MPSASDNTPLKQCTLRPLQETDRDILLTWRNSERVRRGMLHSAIISIETHRIWFAQVQSDQTRLYRVFSYRGRPAGLVYFLNKNEVLMSCEWGFYLGEEDLPKGLGTTLGLLALDLAFQTLNIEKITAKVITTNSASVGFHRKLGFVESGEQQPQADIPTSAGAVLRFVLNKPTWLQVRKKLVDA